MNIKGKFLLSYNDCPEIRQLYSREGIMIESTTRLSNIDQRFDAGKQYPELLIARIRTIIDEREQNPDRYDDSIVRQMIECIKVYHDGRIEIIFGGGYIMPTLTTKISEMFSYTGK